MNAVDVLSMLDSRGIIDRRVVLNVTQSIAACVVYFKMMGELSPSYCDVRCRINDLTQNNPRVVRNGYDQMRAWMAVRKALGTPVTAKDSPFSR